MNLDIAEQPTGKFMRTVLIAEDNKLVVSFIRASLEKFGINIEAVDNGEKAITRAQSGQFDLVVLDNDMPIMDGLTACRILSKDFTVFFYSGEDIAQEALAAGAKKFLSKQCPDLAIKAIMEHLILMRKP
jgi:CheY-like chemotaxis protein